MHAARALPPAHALPPPTHTSPRIIRPAFDSAARVGVQPAAELRHLQRHGHVLHVLRAHLPVPCPQSAVEPSTARCVRHGRPLPPASRAARRPAPYALLSTLGSSRRRSTSRLASTPPASQTWATCSQCVPPRALPPICSRSLSCTLRAPPLPAASRLPRPAPCTPPYALLPTLGRKY